MRPPVEPITLFLCGDVMTGRGIDQILRHPGDPKIPEAWITDARDYVTLAEEQSGAIPRGVEPAYVWGDARDALATADVRILNLETSVTVSDDVWPGKEVHYRMSPRNVDVVTTAGPDVCVLANNHVLDYGHVGLLETLRTLHDAGLTTVGAGRDAAEAQRPAAIALPAGGRVLVFAFDHHSSGVPSAWTARASEPGVDVLPDLSDATASAVRARIAFHRRPGDVIVASIHWGSNWGYDVPHEHVRFAHALIDAGVDVVYGHSSHHPRPIEVYRSKLILYGCGDFLDDYEGISGYEEFRGDLVLAYRPALDPASGALIALQMTPFRIRKLRLERASGDDARWLARRLDRVGRPFGSSLALHDGSLTLLTNESSLRPSL